ncbi:M20 family metallopeptidase [Methanoculleus sp. FWC-SCC1]|uniref:M20 family metallopeptidase n=1 Tax=Methanoculleus frigidifontis TaxID=2584085 RepID=A0ABT8M6H2_9EURY|nr:M20/M25/M40 family metallo-hydrolase [Methanoculleus sp. FWC-SCC1]MDN7023532.1 M20 family metallopeptidase [Methanoculleus sp. FWC-SCC1]
MDVAHLCSSLVQIQSENPPGSTAEVVEYIKGFLDSLGVRSVVDSHPGGRANLVTTAPGARLLLCGHLDVVPAIADGWTHHPYSGDVADGYVWGRGATDMKGGCAALLAAYQKLVNAGEEAAVQFAFVCDEETGGEYGIQSLLAQDLLVPRDCLIAEPTPPLCPTIGQKGLCRLEIDFTGEPGHSSLYPVVGRSAVMEAFDLLEYMKELHQQRYVAGEAMQDLVERSSQALEEVFGMQGLRDVLTRIMYNPGRIEGGEKANIVAERCRMELDIRVPWGCSAGTLLAAITARAEHAAVREINLADPTLTPADTVLVGTLCSAIEAVYAAPAAPILQWAATDARYLRAAGFDVAEYGPGEITLLHAVDERVGVADLENAARVYQRVMAAYSGV